jgi:bla regulator protein BlaR1
MSLILYLLQVTCCLAFFYGFYHMTLRKETLFENNRFYLVGTLAASIVLPLIKIYVDAQTHEPVLLIPPAVYVGSYVDALSANNPIAKGTPFPWDRLVIGVYFLGVSVMAIRFINAIKEIHWIRLQGTKTLVEGRYCILSTKVKSPFSFFNSIYFPKHHQFDEAELKEIVAHELAHVKGRHTLDVLLMEAACILLWPSPLIYLYRKALKDVHEFVADAAVIRDTPWEQYAQLLVGQQQGQLQNILSNQLIYSQLKKRLLMMNKERSGFAARYKYLGFIPVLLITLVLFSFREKLAIQTTQASSIIGQEPEGELIFSIGADQKLYFGLKEITRDEMETVLKDKANSEAENVLTLKADSNATVGYVAEIVRMAERLNFKTVLDTDRKLNIYRDGLPILTSNQPSSLIEERIWSISSKQEDRDLPVFPGCDTESIPDQEMCGRTKLGEYIMANLTYPESVRGAGIEGKVVVRFVVGADGFVKDVVILQTLHPDADQVVSNLFSNMNAKAGRWLPAVKNGKAIDTELVLPVKFGLDDAVEKQKPLAHAEELPRFPGCESISNPEERTACATSKLYEFIYATIKYPEEDRKNKMEGQCIVQFTIGTDGSISDVKVVRSSSEGMKAEVNRMMNVMASMPEKWIPAKDKGQNVAMVYTLPIKFKLEDEVANESIPPASSTNTALDQAISISPNPARETITVSVFEGAHTVKVFDTSGNQVLSQKLPASRIENEQINVWGLKPGQYVVQVIGETKTLSGAFTIIK